MLKTTQLNLNRSLIQIDTIVLDVMIHYAPSKFVVKGENEFWIGWQDVRTETVAWSRYLALLITQLAHPFLVAWMTSVAMF